MTLFRTGCAALALIAATPALAQTPSDADLAALVRAQAAEIAALKSRLDRLENATAVAQASAPVAPVQVAPPYANLTCLGTFAADAGTVASVLIGPGAEQPPWWSLQQTGARTATLHPLVNKVYATVYALVFTPDGDAV